MMIDIGKERNGLYYFEGVKELKSKSNRIFQVAKKMFDKEKILLWHC